MTENGLPEPVRSDIYSDSLCDGMGGFGSNRLFVESGGNILRPRLAYALKLADLKPGLRVLDLGCGRGEVVIRCLQLGCQPAVGVDYARDPLFRAADNARALGLEVNNDQGMILTRADAKALPFANGSIDRVFMLDIVEHLHEWELQAVWSEIKRILSPKGYLVIHTLPNRWALDYGYKLARLLLRRLPSKPPDQRDTFHVNEQSPPQLYHSLKRSGLSCHVWLRDLMVDQAAWWRDMEVTGEEAQETVYRLLNKPAFRAAYRLAMSLPLRLWMATDLFALAWPQGPGPDVLKRLPASLAERAVRAVAS